MKEISLINSFLKILLIFSFILYEVHPKVCLSPAPTYAFPQIIGGATSSTQFYCIDYNYLNRFVRNKSSNVSEILSGTDRKCAE